MIKFLTSNLKSRLQKILFKIFTKLSFARLLFLSICPLCGICQLPDKQEKSFYTSNALYLDNIGGAFFGIKYDRNILRINNFKINTAIGLSTMPPILIPPNISSPLEINILYGLAHHLEVGLIAMPVYWFTKGFSYFMLFGNGPTYHKNALTISSFFRLGYRYQKGKGIFFKTSIGPPLFELYSNYPEYEYFDYFKGRKEMEKTENNPMLILLWPGIGIGYSF